MVLWCWLLWPGEQEGSIKSKGQCLLGIIRNVFVPFAISESGTQVLMISGTNNEEKTPRNVFT